MTEYYNAKEVDSRHLVLFRKPDENKEYYYYVFEKKKWIRCYPIDNLPYDLCSFRLEGKTENEAVVTCHDSYRLCEYLLDEDDDDELIYEEMLKEKEWRDSIVKEDAEMDFRHEKGWTKAKVCWTKADIIPGVVVIGPRKCPNIGTFGYFYKESERLVKSSTYTPVITDEEITEEERLANEAAISIAKEKEIADMWKSKIGLQVPEKYKNSWGFLLGSSEFYDTLPIYQSLCKYNEEVTVEKIKKLDPEFKDNKDTRNSPAFRFVTLQPQYQVAYQLGEIKIKPQSDPKKSYFYLSEFSAYADIKIFGATWAYMWCGDHDDFYQDPHSRKFEMEKVDDYFTFTDITYENPLFRATIGSALFFHTDGNLATFKGIMIDGKTSKLFLNLGNAYAITHFPKRGRILFNGHLWQPSYSCSYDELISVPITEKENEECKPEIAISM